MVVLLRHRGEVIRSRTGATCEYDFELTPRANPQHQGAGEAHLVVWPLSPAGVPIFAAGTAGPLPITCTRSEVSVYRQAAPELGFARSQAGTTAALFHQPVGRTGAASTVGRNQGAWLRANVNLRCNATPIFCRIATFAKSFPRSINGWCPKHSLQRLRATGH
jgi:hypothetical protein